MGELIRNLNPISIGNSSLMIELNEGYVKEEGRLIHIQNKQFRYLLSEEDFVCFAATILRAKEEMNYVRKKMSKSVKSEIDSVKTHSLIKENEIALFFCDKLEGKKVPYRMVEIKEGVCTFIVERKSFLNSIGDIPGVRKMTHPYSVELGYTYLYQMHPFMLYIKDNCLLEIFFELPCYSLTEKTWIPLHKSIQKRIFENDTIVNGIHYLDGLTYCIYRLCWAIFKKQVLSEYDVEVIRKYKAAITSQEAYSLLYEVFYKYTDYLLNHIKKEEFKEIVKDYYNFLNY